MSADLRKRWAQAGGAFPESWKVVPLETLLRDSKGIAVGVMYPGPNTPGGVPLIKVGDVNGGLVSLRPSYCVSAEVNADYKRTQLAGNELLITLVGNPGECVVVKQHMAGWNVARAVAVIRLEDPSLRVYLKTVLESTACRHLIDAVLNTTVQKTLNLKDIRLLPIPMPPKRVIQAISCFSNALNDRIALLRETNATLEAIAQALFKSWFVDFDPVRAKAEGLEPEGMGSTTAALFPDSFEESELGLAPRGWRMSTLGAICESNGGAIQTGPFGSQLHASDYVANGVPVVMPKDISGRRVDATTTARILPKDADRLLRHQLRGGDIVFSRRGDVEKHALIGEVERGWLCGTGCLLARPGTRRNMSGYLSRSLDLPQTKQWLTQHAVGATMPNLNTGILSAVPVLLPADEVLAAFEQVTSAFDERISESNAKAKTLTELRDTLLPRLISGQMRLPETDDSIKNMLSESV